MGMCWGFFRLILLFLNGWVRESKEEILIWMMDFLGYFLLFECMLESIIYARNTYLDKENGLGK
jgi:hypothetical protein